VAAILSGDGQDGEIGAVTEINARSTTRSRRLRDRFSSEDFQEMIDLYRSGTTAKRVAEKFGLSLRSVKRLLHEHDVHKRLRRMRQTS
jgi:hypothetical protein